MTCFLMSYTGREKPNEIGAIRGAGGEPGGYLGAPRRPLGWRRRGGRASAGARRSSSSLSTPMEESRRIRKYMTPSAQTPGFLRARVRSSHSPTWVGAGGLLLPALGAAPRREFLTAPGHPRCSRLAPKPCTPKRGLREGRGWGSG